MKQMGSAVRAAAVPKQLAVPSDLDMESRRSVAAALNPLVADAPVHRASASRGPCRSTFKRCAAQIKCTLADAVD